MPKKRDEHPECLVGWATIARYLGQPVPVAQRWAHEGMPVERQGRYVAADTEQLRAWLGRESHASGPVQIASSAEELTAGLKRGIVAARRKHSSHPRRRAG